MSETEYLPVDVCQGIDKDLFGSSKRRTPMVIKGYDIGPCVEKWTVDYLCEKVDGIAANAHVCTTSAMDFIDKNFSCENLPFTTLLRRASEKVHSEYFLSPDEYYYFRSLSADSAAQPASMENQFPALKKDINFPDVIPKDRFFSSVMRVASAGMQLWTHYDIMDNFLLQISGRKRVVFFPPSDVQNLYLVGHKSSIPDIDKPDLDRYPKFANVTRYQCVLEPGDVLFIPALWFHNVVALEFGLAVNVFWRHLDEQLYDPKDIYGHKDLVPAAHGKEIVEKALAVLNELPHAYREFYARQIIVNIEDKTQTKNSRA